MHKRRAEPLLIGWREWVGLPELGLSFIKAKVDSGAKTSALHAFDLEDFRWAGADWVRFSLLPSQRSTGGRVEAEAQVMAWRQVRSSSGHRERRPVILTSLALLGRCWEIELTLTNRDELGFRMLLGRQALGRSFLVDPGGSFYNGRPPRIRPSDPQS